jgi:hypothetical protein
MRKALFAAGALLACLAAFSCQQPGAPSNEPPSVTAPSACATIGSGGVAVFPFDGKKIYTLIAAAPAAKPQGEGTPTGTYTYSLATAAGVPLEIAPPPTRGAAMTALAGMPGFSSAQADVDTLMRNAERLLLASGLRQRSPAATRELLAVPSPIVVGTTWSNIKLIGNVAITATCRFISSRACFFVDNRDIAAMDSYLADYRTAFDGINTMNHARFGTENDTDGNARLVIVFSETLTGGILGYFSPLDKFPTAQYPASNQGDIFYVTTDSSPQGTTIKGTLAHEFQHMIYFDQHYNRGVTSTYTWLNEALSQGAEYFNNYPTNHEGWMSYFLNGHWSGLSLTSWTSANYGYGAVFIRYLIDRFGDTAIYTMCSTANIGIAAVESATGTDFNTIYNDFTRALVMSGTGDCAEARYNFTTLDLRSVQSSGRGGMTTSFCHAAGASISGSLYPYALQFDTWTGSFGTMSLTGTAGGGTAFGLSR